MNLISTYLHQGNKFLYAGLLLAHFCFPLIIRWSPLREMNLFVLSIYYYLLSAQIELFLFAIVLYFYSFKKILQNKKEYYLFPVLILLADCLFSATLLKSRIQLVGILIKLLSCMLFLCSGWSSIKETLFCPSSKKTIRYGIFWGSALFLVGFAHSVIPNLGISYSSAWLVTPPILISLVQVLYTVRRTITPKNVLSFWVSSNFVWLLLSSWLGNSLYALLQNFFMLPATYVDNNYRCFFVFQIINLIAMGLLWLFNKIRKLNTGDVAQET